MKILLVDDDAFLRDMYAVKFGELKHTVDVAENAELALAKLRENEYDAVLLDMIMPGMTGVDLLARIKEENIGGSPICIMLSNQSEETDRTAALEAGAAGYIVKAERIPSEVVEEVLKYVGQK